MAFRTNKMPVLQEKSASGAVASFNTALAMPLVECKTEFMCKEIGTGEKSPSNPYTLVGVDKVGIIGGCKNLLNGESGEVDNVTITYDSTTGEYTINGTSSDNTFYYVYLPYELPVGSYVISAVNQVSDIIIRVQTVNNVNATTLSLDVVNNSRPFTTTYNIGRYLIRLNAGTTYTNYKLKLQLEAGNTKTSFEPYSQYTVILIDLDGTRYGGYVDVVRDKCILTWYGKKLSDLSWTRITSGVEYPYFRADFSDYKYVSNNSNIMCEVYKFNGSIGAIGSTEGLNATSDGRLRIRDNSYSDRDTWLADVGNYIIAYELSTPIEISLSDIPTLSTIIGNNSFASDSGSIELTYKDLDIAKRGNFREVFKLPS